MTRMALAVTATALVAWGAVAPPAQAGTIGLNDSDGEYSRDNYFSVWYRAAAGEDNRVTVKYDSLLETITFTDPAAAEITPEPDTMAAERCTFAAERVTCTTSARAQTNYVVDLGDGDDTSRTDIAPSGVTGGVVIDGGEGSDVLTHRGAGSLAGGYGDDRLTGGSGAQILWGGAGADVLDGGADRDTVDPYAHFADDHDAQNPTTGVAISLDGVANDGVPGEGDNVVSTEVIEGTPFDDVLIGGAADDYLIGEDGDDQLTGGPGFDGYWCGEGEDAVTADRFDGIYSVLYPPYSCETGAPKL